MSNMVESIQRLIKSRTGIDTSTMGEHSLERILNSRMQKCSITNLDEYYKRIQTDKAEWTELLEATVVPETWFFRDTRPLKTIENDLRKHINSNSNSNTPYNIMCMPCSSGEEAYSIAMYLLSQNIPATAFHIDACDISQSSINRATEGVYGNNSFRGNDYKKYIDHFFKKDNNRYIINKHMLGNIDFYKANILKIESYTNRPYNTITCRNLLIYFDEDSKRKAYKNIYTSLHQKGMLFIGHSEFGSMPVDLFSNMGSEYSFALTRTDNTNTKTASLNKSSGSYFNKGRNTNNTTAYTPPANTDKPILENKTFTSLSNTTNIQNIENANETISIENAIRLADNEELDKAKQICEKLLSSNDNNAEAYFLLGLIYFSKNNINKAEAMLRKSLFLNPEHYDALSHLAILLSSKGDSKSAELFRKRAERINQSDNRGPA